MDGGAGAAVVGGADETGCRAGQSLGREGCPPAGFVVWAAALVATAAAMTADVTMARILPPKTTRPRKESPAMSAAAAETGIPDRRAIARSEKSLSIGSSRRPGRAPRPRTREEWAVGAATGEGTGVERPPCRRPPVAPFGRGRPPGLPRLTVTLPSPYGPAALGAGSSVVEHVTFNHVVAGSIPARLTNEINDDGNGARALACCRFHGHRV